MQLGHQVRILDRSGSGGPNLGSLAHRMEVCEGDFTNKTDVRQAVEGMEVIYHLVSTTVPSKSNENPIFDVESNVAGSINLLEAAVACRVSKVIFASSGGTVYGVPRQCPVPEEHSTQPVCSYGITKLAIEKYLHLFHVLHGLEYNILRIANPYGPRQNWHGIQGAATVFLGKTFFNEAIHIWGDGSIKRDFLYIDDLVAAFLAAMNRDTASRIFNVGSGSSVSLLNLLETIRKISGKIPAVTFGESRNFDVPDIALDISKASRELGWEPQVSLEDGLSKTWAWLKQSNPLF